MKYVQAVIALGLFGWLGFAVYTDTLPGGDGASGKSRALHGIVTSATEQFGVLQTSLALVSVGVLLAAFFLMRKEPDYEY